MSLDIKLEGDPLIMLDCGVLGFESEREREIRLYEPPRAQREREKERDKVIERVRKFQRTGAQN